MWRSVPSIQDENGGLSIDNVTELYAYIVVRVYPELNGSRYLVHAKIVIRWACLVHEPPEFIRVNDAVQS